jgi:ABC-type transport system substrate-binding protein
LAKNPLADERVRSALSPVINSAAIISSLTSGLAWPTGNVVPEMFPGFHLGGSRLHRHRTLHG